VSADLITQIVTLALVIYFGLHLRTQLRTVKSTVEAQKATIDAQAEQMKALKATIDAQAEQMKAQSTVLQDFERLNKIMQQVIDFVDPETQLKREQAYRAWVDREVPDQLEQQAKELEAKGQQTVEQVRHQYLDVLGGTMNLIATLLLYVSFEHRTELIETAKLSPSIKTQLRRFAHDAPYCLDTGIRGELRLPQSLEEETSP
jgi:septal ring factor EnvC (AmiA/AmiB activator)